MIRELELIKMPLTPEGATEHNRLPQISGDRRLDPKRVSHLETKVADGLFHSPSWAVAFYAGKKYRINGKHSSHVLAKVNGHFPPGLFVTIQQFQCDTYDDLVTLFEQFDAAWSTRTKGDRINVHKSVHPELEKISPTTCAVAVTGITYALSEDGRMQIGDDEQTRLIHEHIGFVLWAKDFVGIRRMRRIGVIAAMFATRRRDAEWAAEFWKYVRDESHERADHPTRTLGEFLKLSVLDKNDRHTGKPWTTRAFYVKSIHAWNADREGRRTDLKYHALSPWPRMV